MPTLVCPQCHKENTGINLYYCAHCGYSFRKPERKAGTGVTMIAAFTILRGVISIIWVMYSSAIAIAQNGLPGIAYAILGFGLTITSIVVGIALWELKPWARVGALALWTIQAILALLSLGDNMVTLALAIIIIVYLSGKDVKQAFQENR